MMDKQQLTALVIEDNPDDVCLLRALLSRVRELPITMEHSDRLSAALAVLAQKKIDVILLDLGLPDSRDLDSFLSVHSQYPDIPVVILTGFEDETLAVETVRKGAQDYLVKGKVGSEVLGRVIRYAIERHKLIAELQKNLREIKTLRGLLPICAWCKSVRDDEGYWKNLETYIQEHTSASFTHGICPRCLDKASSDETVAEPEKKSPTATTWVPEGKFRDLYFSRRLSE